ncbi:hypothetical protein IFT84_01455 [Rhizobium sp. CFBP 8762]|uniref:hypothetical protein n=1 Tax=Rhizobium sp. CFBP 8762 TaxID=2775279 RepID=UPI00177CF03F|nr:hypothetical protein [Rhizobium sp. CFBP 8762]MBD8553183.1 hypothetical protein [Rhizobium sp. CFBP 8762]
MDVPDIDSGLFGLVLDTKAGPSDPTADYQDMLAAMTRELRERFQAFQQQRLIAERLAADEEAGEAARKGAQADAKAASDTLLLMVRILEKIDTLQRAVAHDREARAETDFDGQAYDRLRAEFGVLVEARAKELAGDLAAELVSRNKQCEPDRPGVAPPPDQSGQEA